jgi:hypothetical protein
MAVLAFLAAGCGSGSASSSDSVARAACGDFRQLARDASDGILTGDEQRERVQRIHDRGRYGDSAEVADASRELLAAFTTGDDREQGAAVGRMGAACEQLDF